MRIDYERGMTMKDQKKLYILWTNADVNAAQFMVMMYATNAMLNGWWDEVVVIIWGATVKLTAENEGIQQKIRIAMQAGVTFSACISCAEQFGVVNEIQGHGIETIPWGAPLTEIIKSGIPLLTV